MNEFESYTGEELALFEKAIKWKRYFSTFIRPYIKGDVLEVGAGLSANTPYLNDGSPGSWVLVEPDTEMATNIGQKIKSGKLPSNCSVVNGMVSSLEKKPAFDTILYIDVLEHTTNDTKEIENANIVLRPGGHVIILSPAFPSLFSPFDKAIGHYTRYTKPSLKKLFRDPFSRVDLRYLDSTGYFISLANRLLLRQNYPTQRQIDIWDSYDIPLARLVDRMVNYSFGRSILGIWKKEKG